VSLIERITSRRVSSAIHFVSIRFDFFIFFDTNKMEFHCKKERKKEKKKTIRFFLSFVEYHHGLAQPLRLLVGVVPKKERKIKFYTEFKTKIKTFFLTDDWVSFRHSHSARGPTEVRPVPGSVSLTSVPGCHMQNVSKSNFLIF